MTFSPLLDFADFCGRLLVSQRSTPPADADGDYDLGHPAGVWKGNGWRPTYDARNKALGFG